VEVAEADETRGQKWVTVQSVPTVPTVPDRARLTERLTTPGSSATVACRKGRPPLGAGRSVDKLQKLLGRDLHPGKSGPPRKAEAE